MSFLQDFGSIGCIWTTECMHTNVLSAKYCLKCQFPGFQSSGFKGKAVRFIEDAQLHFQVQNITDLHTGEDKLNLNSKIKSEL